MASAARKMFVNLAVKDVPRAKGFFTALGFEINPMFSNDQCVCVLINELASAMLLDEAFFKTFTRKALVNAHESTELLCAISVDSRAAVDKMMADALALGATEARDAQDEGFMYGRAFSDLDGHIWEIFWMNPSPPPGAEGQTEPEAKKSKGEAEGSE